MYWQQNLARSFRDSWHFVLPTSAKSILPAILATLASVAGAYWLQRDQTNVVIATAGLTVLFLVAAFGLLFIAHLLFVTPRRMWVEERSAAEVLQKQQTPCVRIVEGKHSIDHIAEGSSAETLGGKRITVSRSSQSLLRLRCTNDKQAVVADCRCRMLKASKKTDTGWSPIEMLESVELSWSRDLRNPVLSVDIEPGEVRTVYIARVAVKGQVWLFRDTSTLPAEYQRIFGESGTYQILLQFRSSATDAYQAVAQFETREVDVVPNTIPRPDADVEVLAQGLPHLPFPFTAAL